MNNNNQPVKNPIEDQRAAALAHYNEASTAVNHWSSFVDAAIKAYNPEPPAEVSKAELIKVLFKSAKKTETTEGISIEVMFEKQAEDVIEYLLKKGTVPAKEVRLPVNGEVWKTKEGSKFVVGRRNSVEEMEEAGLDNFEYVCDRPHADGDFSYFCSSNWCRCQQ